LRKRGKKEFKEEKKGKNFFFFLTFVSLFFNSDGQQEKKVEGFFFPILQIKCTHFDGEKVSNLTKR